MLSYHIQTFGCSMNYSDSERMEAYLDALGMKKHDGFEGFQAQILEKHEVSWWFQAQM